MKNLTKKKRRDKKEGTENLDVFERKKKLKKIFVTRILKFFENQGCKHCPNFLPQKKKIINNDLLLIKFNHISLLI